MTSTISPSTAAARSRFLMQRPSGGRGRAIVNTRTPPTIRTAAIGRLTVTTKATAATVATHGGNTFQTNMFSKV